MTATEWIDRQEAIAEWERRVEADREARYAYRAETERRLIAALESGDSVIEHATYGELVWPRETFTARGRLLAYHLMQRHTGFGFDLTIGGERRSWSGRHD